MPVPAVDPSQRAVIALAPDASGVVVGAAGSGKTLTVIERVRALLAGGLGADELLVLTPTRASATALRDRLAFAVGVATPGPLARSVAAFAFELVRAHAVRTGAEPPQLLTGPDEDRIVQDLLLGDAEDERTGPSRWPDWLTSEIRATRGFRTEVRAFLAECTTLGIGPAALAELAVRHDLPIWESLAGFAAEYHEVRQSMRGAHRDAAGLVREAVGLARTLDAEDPGLLSRLRAIIVDDAQELTRGGVELLDACRARGIAVIAFGDPDISAGAFRGATPENFALLAAELPVHVLRGAHRGTPVLQDLTARVVSRIGVSGVVDHRRTPSSPEPDDSLQAFVLRSGGEEHDVIARTLRERHIHDGIPWERCAVIAHDSAQVTTLEAELAARDVPTASGQGRTLSQTRAVRELLTLIALAVDDDWDGDAPVEGLRGGGMDVVEIRRLRAALRQRALRAGGQEPVPSGRELLASGMRHPVEFELLDTREGRRAARIAQTVAMLREQSAAGATAHELLWTAWEHSGRARRDATLGTGPLARQARRELDDVVALFQAAKRHGERDDGTPAIGFIRGSLESDVAEDRLNAPTSVDAVQVITPAAALGAEFDTVVIAGVQDGVWPNLRVRGGLLETWRLATASQAEPPSILDRRRGVLHDELRLFARSVSRARSRVVVTAVDDADTGPSVLFEFLPPASPAPSTAGHPLSLRGLVAQLRRTLTDPAALPQHRRDAAQQLVLLADSDVPGADPEQWYGVAAPTGDGPLYDLSRDEVRISPSKLDAIADCQLNWVIGDLGGDAGGTSAGVGTLIHAALEHATGSDPEQLWQEVADRWGELEFEAVWLDRAERARARDLVGRLAAYLRDSERAGTTVISAEGRFELALPVADAARPVVISGTIDRVEKTADGRVVVVDLKTGKSQATADAAVADNPQLSAYQLALEHGRIPGAADLTPGGAKLLVLRKTRHAEYATPTQPPFDQETRAAFLDRIARAVHVMGGREFLAPYESHCRDDHTHGLCRIHTIGPVSSS